jgi:hypothetical protein
MKACIVWMCLSLAAQTSLAHDGPHGPEINDGGKYGGQLAAVIKLKSGGGHKDHAPEIQYKAEFVRNEGQEVRLYLYDKAMKKLDISAFPAKLDGVIESKWKGKNEIQAFSFEKSGEQYVGKAPAPKRRPFNLEVQFKMKGETYFAGLENQD